MLPVCSKKGEMEGNVVFLDGQIIRWRTKYVRYCIGSKVCISCMETVRKFRNLLLLDCPKSPVPNQVLFVLPLLFCLFVCFGLLFVCLFFVLFVLGCCLLVCFLFCLFWVVVCLFVFCLFWVVVCLFFVLFVLGCCLLVCFLFCLFWVVVCLLVCFCFVLSYMLAYHVFQPAVSPQSWPCRSYLLDYNSNVCSGHRNYWTNNR